MRGGARGACAPAGGGTAHAAGLGCAGAVPAMVKCAGAVMPAREHMLSACAGAAQGGTQTETEGPLS